MRIKLEFLGVLKDNPADEDFNKAVDSVVNSNKFNRARYSSLLFLLVMYCEKKAEMAGSARHGARLNYGMLPMLFQKLCLSDQKEIFVENTLREFDVSQVDDTLKAEYKGG